MLEYDVKSVSLSRSSPWKEGRIKVWNRFDNSISLRDDDDDLLFVWLSAAAAAATVYEYKRGPASRAHNGIENGNWISCRCCVLLLLLLLLRVCVYVCVHQSQFAILMTWRKTGHAARNQSLWHFDDDYFRWRRVKKKNKKSPWMLSLTWNPS